MLFSHRKANSDDEEDDTGAFVIRPKVGRAEKVTTFICDSDPRRLKMEKANKSNRRCVPSMINFYTTYLHAFVSIYRKERVRIEIPDPPASPFTTFPDNVPLNYIEPMFWRDEMTALQKYRIIKNGIKIALPSAEKCKKEFWHTWKGLNHAEFMLRHGFAELAKFR